MERADIVLKMAELPDAVFAWQAVQVKFGFAAYPLMCLECDKDHVGEGSPAALWHEPHSPDVPMIFPLPPVHEGVVLVMLVPPRGLALLWQYTLEQVWPAVS